MRYRIPPQPQRTDHPPDLYGDRGPAAWEDVAGLWPELDTPVWWTRRNPQWNEHRNTVRRALVLRETQRRCQ